MTDFDIRTPFGRIERHDRPIDLLPPIPPMGWLRAVQLDVWTTTAAPARAGQRPRAAADRTRSRRAMAGSKRARRYGVRPPGPAGRPDVETYDHPFSTITGYDLYAINRFGKAS